LKNPTIYFFFFLLPSGQTDVMKGKKKCRGREKRFFLFVGGLDVL